jgi:hypothetical protein
MTKVKIILVQSRNSKEALQYRVAKLVGGVSVSLAGPTGTFGRRTLHVGDMLNEAEAQRLSWSNEYELTVTEKGGAT